MQQARILQSTADRYRVIASTITDQDIARRLLDYADELCGRAEAMIAAARDAVGSVEER